MARAVLLVAALHGAHTALTAADQSRPALDDKQCDEVSLLTVSAHIQSRRAMHTSSKRVKRTSDIAQMHQQFKIHAAEKEEARKNWENIFQQLLASFTTVAHEPEAGKKSGQAVALRGPGGLCTSCKADGQIFRALNFSNNEKVGNLDSVHLTRVPGKVDSDAIYTIDEYRLGEDKTPFRYLGIFCKKWFVNRCLEDDTSRMNLWTEKSVARWAQWVTPGSNAIDIGANVGDTTVEMAMRAKKTLAFEANPRAALHCQTHALLNPQLNIKVHPVAVAPTDGIMQLNVDCGGCNSGPVETRKWRGTVVEVPQRRLDTLLLQEHGVDFLKNVSFIKIDTEGYDKTLLRTYKPLLNISKPTFWVEWFNPYWQTGSKNETSDGSSDLFAAINEIGYVPLNPHTMKVVTPESRNGVEDLLLLPAEKVK